MYTRGANGIAFKGAVRAALPLAGRLIPEFNLRAFHMGYVVDKVARVHPFIPVSLSFHQCLSVLVRLQGCG